MPQVINSQGQLKIYLSGSSGAAFSAGTSSNSLGSVVFSNSNLISFGLNGSTITASAGVAVNSFHEPIAWDAVNSGTSTYGINTLGLQYFILGNYLSFNQLNLIGSATLSSTSASNKFSISCGGASSFGFSYTATITNSNLVNAILFTRGSGNYTDELFTIASTQNSFVTYMVVAHTLSVTGGAASWSATASSNVSVTCSFPGMTSGQSINGASSWTTWGPGYTNATTSISTSGSTTQATSAASSFSVAGTWNNITNFASNKIVPLAWATSLTPGEYWLGIWRTRGTASNSASANANVGANHSYTTTINASNMTLTGQISWAGSTASIVNSLGWIGFASQATMAPSPGRGSLSATYAPNSTYLNAAGQPNGAIAFSQINTNVSFFRSWIQFAYNRI